MSVATVKQAVNKLAGEVYGDLEEFSYSSSNLFNGADALGTTPSSYITLTSTDGKPIVHFWLDSVEWYFECNGAAPTHQLVLLEATNADDIESGSDRSFQTPTGLLDATHYFAGHGGRGVKGTTTTVDLQLPKLVRLETPNRLYHLIPYSSSTAASSVRGYLKVRGRPLLVETVG